MNYSKAIAAAVATIISAIIGALTGDNAVTPQEWINVAVLFAGALMVFTAPNVPGAAFTKSILAAITAVLVLAVNLIAGGLDLSEWLQLAMAAFAALGVYAVRNGETDATIPA